MTECTMCLNTINVNDPSVVKTPCGHHFHRIEIKRWLDTCNVQHTTPTCPNCRHEIKDLTFLNENKESVLKKIALFVIKIFKAIGDFIIQHSDTILLLLLMLTAQNEEPRYRPRPVVFSHPFSYY